MTEMKPYILLRLQCKYKFYVRTTRQRILRITFPFNGDKCVASVDYPTSQRRSPSAMRAPRETLLRSMKDTCPTPRWRLDALYTNVATVSYRQHRRCPECAHWRSRIGAAAGCPKGRATATLWNRTLAVWCIVFVFTQ